MLPKKIKEFVGKTEAHMHSAKNHQTELLLLMLLMLLLHHRDRPNILLYFGLYSFQAEKT